jgi:hypothetical protein
MLDKYQGPGVCVACFSFVSFIVFRSLWLVLTLGF